MNNKTNSVLFLIVGLVLGGLMMYFFNNYKIEKRTSDAAYAETGTSKPVEDRPAGDPGLKDSEDRNITKLTAETTVIQYVKTHQRLPDYYITKAEARKAGWEPSRGNLCDVLPGKAIGGDRFSNREKTLPSGAQYYEADVNYSCGRRGAHRIVYTANGDVWLTKNHYKSFEKQ